MDQRIVYSWPDGRVSIVIPAPNFIAGITGAGGLIAPEERDEQIARHMARPELSGPGLSEVAATRYVDACINGGLTYFDALQIMASAVVPHWALHAVVWHVDVIPSDRWFRDAWRRDLTGGPIIIDLDVARAIQAQRIVAKRAAIITHLAAEADKHILMGRGSNILPFLLDAWRGLDMAEIGQKIGQAITADEIRRVFDLERIEDDPEFILNWRLPE